MYAIKYNTSILVCIGVNVYGSVRGNKPFTIRRKSASQTQRVREVKLSPNYGQYTQRLNTTLTSIETDRRLLVSQRKLRASREQNRAAGENSQRGERRVKTGEWRVDPTRACVPVPCDLCCGRGDMLSAAACCAEVEPPAPAPPPGRSSEFVSEPACDCGGVDADGAMKPATSTKHAIDVLVGNVGSLCITVIRLITSTNIQELCTVQSRVSKCAAASTRMSGGSRSWRRGR